jgi:cyclohexa-1,5-dienecarbonyl-CoA hydratase
MVQLECADGVARVILNRPPLNIINIAMMREMMEAVQEAERRRAWLLQLEPSPACRSFSAGVDVADHVPEHIDEMLCAFHAVFRRLAAGRFLTLALVRGSCLGGGCELACFCDAVVADADAVFGFPEIRLGCFPPAAVAFLPELVGMRRALDWILSGRNIPAPEALATGLITAIGDAGAESARIRAQWRTLSPQVLRLTKRLMRVSDFERRLAEVEAVYKTELARHPDAREGVQAFLEKREPKWSRIPRIEPTGELLQPEQGAAARVPEGAKPVPENIGAPAAANEPPPES